MLSEVCRARHSPVCRRTVQLEATVSAASVNYRAAFDEWPRSRGSVAMVRGGSAHFLAGEPAAA